MARIAGILFVVVGLAFGGCLASSETDGEPILTSVNWDGNTGTGVCVPTFSPGCYRLATKNDTLESIDTWGNLTGGLVLTWDAVTPQAEILELTVFVAGRCWAICGSYRADYDPIVVQGSSPLKLSVKFDIPAGHFLVMQVTTPGLATPEPAGGRADIDQPFQVEGIVTAVR